MKNEMRATIQETKVKALLHAKYGPGKYEADAHLMADNGMVFLRVGDNTLIEFTTADFHTLAMTGLGMITPAQKAG